MMEGGGASSGGAYMGGGIDDWMVVEIIDPMSRPRRLPDDSAAGGMPLITGASGAVGTIEAGAASPSGSGMA